MTKIIAIDVDGVLVNYREAYAEKWFRAFGVRPNIKNKDAYTLWNYYDIPFLESNEDRAKLEACSDSEFWADMNPLDGALEATHILKDLGYDLVAVTACSPEFHNERAINLQNIGYPLSDVFCVGAKGIDGKSPKAKMLSFIKPDYFIDDYLGYFYGIDEDIKKVLIDLPVNPSHPKVSRDEIDIVATNLLDAANKIKELTI